MGDVVVGHGAPSSSVGFWIVGGNGSVVVRVFGNYVPGVQEAGEVAEDEEEEVEEGVGGADAAFDPDW